MTKKKITKNLITPFRAPHRSGKKYRNKKEHIKATLKWRKNKHKNNPKGKNPGDVLDLSNVNPVLQGRRRDIELRRGNNGKIHWEKHPAKEGYKEWHNPNGKNPGDVIHSSGAYRNVKRSLLKNPQVRKNHDLHHDGTGYYPQGKNPGDVITQRHWKNEEKAGFKRGATNPHRAANLGGLLSGKAKNHPLGKNPGDTYEYYEHNEEPDARKSIKQKLAFKRKVLGMDHDSCMNYPNGKNPGDFWTISTKPFPEAHFAVYPEELCLKPILSSCPELVCDNCGKPKRKVINTGKNQNAFNIRVRDVKKGKLKSSNRKATKLETDKYNENLYVSKSYKRILSHGCKCNKGYKPGIVLDPFCGSGTTCLVAAKLGRSWIGIDIKNEYCKMARKRIKKAQKT